jgi:hypothetical protein
MHDMNLFIPITKIDTAQRLVYGVVTAEAPDVSGEVCDYASDCEVCSFKPRCCPNTRSRKVVRDINEQARDRARALMGTPAFAKSRDDRKKVEMRFAHLKTHHRFERMRLRGLSGARDEFQLAAIVQNLKTLASQLWQPLPMRRHRASCEGNSSNVRTEVKTDPANRDRMIKGADRDPRASPRPFINGIDP